MFRLISFNCMVLHIKYGMGGNHQWSNELLIKVQETTETNTNVPFKGNHEFNYEFESYPLATRNA